jgi:hypothetical protein
MEYDEADEFTHVQNADKNYAFFKTVGRQGGLKPHRLTGSPTSGIESTAPRPVCRT